nr:MAG TPA: hypothetical protein [Caudoviricetes sp.]
MNTEQDITLYSSLRGVESSLYYQLFVYCIWRMENEIKSDVFSYRESFITIHCQFLTDSGFLTFFYYGKRDNLICIP